MEYTALWNMPGCLPEMEPATFESFDEAKRFLIDEMKTQEDIYGCEGDSENDAEEFCHTAEDVNLWSSPCCTDIMPDGYVYCIDES